MVISEAIMTYFLASPVTWVESALLDKYCHFLKEKKNLNQLLDKFSQTIMYDYIFKSIENKA